MRRYTALFLTLLYVVLFVGCSEEAPSVLSYVEKTETGFSWKGLTSTDTGDALLEKLGWHTSDVEIQESNLGEFKPVRTIYKKTEPMQFLETGKIDATFSFITQKDINGCHLMSSYISFEGNEKFDYQKLYHTLKSKIEDLYGESILMSGDESSLDTIGTQIVLHWYGTDDSTLSLEYMNVEAKSGVQRIIVQIGVT